MAVALSPCAMAAAFYSYYKSGLIPLNTRTNDWSWMKTECPNITQYPLRTYPCETVISKPGSLIQCTNCKKPLSVKIDAIMGPFPWCVQTTEKENNNTRYTSMGDLDHPYCSELYNMFNYTIPIQHKHNALEIRGSPRLSQVALVFLLTQNCTLPAPLEKLVIRRVKRSDPLHTYTQTSWSRILGALIPNYGVMAALDQVRDLSVSVESLANLTTNSITLINTQLSSTRLMVLQNRAALDYLLAAVGGTCKVVGPECCTDITDVSANLTQMLNDMKTTIAEIHSRNNNNDSWDPLALSLGSFGYTILQYALYAAVAVIILLIIIACIKALISTCFKTATNMMNSITPDLSTNIPLTTRISFSEWAPYSNEELPNGK